MTTLTESMRNLLNKLNENEMSEEPFVVLLEYTRRYGEMDDEEYDENIHDSLNQRDDRAFYIDIDKVKEALNHGNLMYSKHEMMDLLDCLQNDRSTLRSGGEKYSLYDTPDEYEMVKADIKLAPELADKTLYRLIYV